MDTARWQARRGSEGATLAECVRDPSDLGGLAHVRKVLLATFPGSQEKSNQVTWTKGDLTLRATPEDVPRPRFVEFEVSVQHGSVSEAILSLSPKLRKLLRDRNWVFFDIASNQQLLLAPPRAAPRRKKGLTTLAIDSNELAKELDHRLSGEVVLFGGLESVRELDAFLDNTPLPELLSGLTGSFGWTNLEIVVPGGQTFYAIRFRGEASAVLRDWYVALARRGNLPVATVSADEIRIGEEPKSLRHALADCRGILHNVWESSITARH